MFKKLFIVFLLKLNLYSLGIVSDDLYKIHDTKLYTIVYSKEYEKEALFIKNNINNFLEENDKSFSYRFDEKIKIVLASNKTQIPNAFSSQVPFNINVNYNGGSALNSYFANKSWLKTIFIHEMIHNYQINAKKSKVSQTLHEFFGNNYEPIFFIIPFFTIPNVLLPTLLLEGNAVYNESLYKNGGRLFNGSLNALKNTLIFDNKITSSRLINDHLSFPYGNEKYIVGGFYMKYLSEIYGHNKVNEFFYENSRLWLTPLLLSSTFKKVFNTTFEKSIKNFVKYTKNKYSSFKLLKNKNLASSKSNIYLSKINNKIYFISSNLINKKELNIFNIKNNILSKTATNLVNQKIFRINNKLYTNTSNTINTNEIKFALFDENIIPIKQSIGKYTYDINNNNHAYLDINSSFNSSRLYINNKFYDQAESNALFDKNNNIYYFKQENEQRVLYKNKIELYRFKGYFSKLVDIFEDEVYFIANTKNGSSLYKLSNNKTYSLSAADNIINAKIINKDKALVVTITSKQYELSKIHLKVKEQMIYYEKMINEIEKFTFNENTNNQKLTSKNYNEFKQLEFSSIYPSFYSSNEGNTYSLNANFTDSLYFNSSNIYAFNNQDKSILGINYSNQRYTLPFLFNIYNIKRDIQYSNQRNFGANVKVQTTLLKNGRHKINLNYNKYYSDTNKNKNPNILNLNYNYSNSFALESNSFFLNDLNIFIKEDRDDLIYGINTKTNRHIINEFYVHGQALVYTSDIKNLIEQRGIQIVSDKLELLNDESNVFIHNIKDLYVKDISKLSLGFSKSLYFSKYFARFPLSLRKESIFYTKNLYNMKLNSNLRVNEDIFGINFDLLLAHKLSIPLTIKYIKNDFLRQNKQVNISSGFKF